MPHKANAARRHHIPRAKRTVTNWAEYDAALRQRGSLTLWVTDKAIEQWKAAPRTTPGGQPHYSDLAITTALMLKAVFRLALRQTEGLIGSVLQLLGVDLPVPDHSTIARRARTVTLLSAPRSSGGPLHLLVDSTGLKLCGPGEWLIEKHGTKRRRSWHALHIGMDASTGRIVAATLTERGVDDASQVGPLLDQITEPVASVTGDGAYDRTRVYAAVQQRHPAATVVAPPRVDAVLSATAAIAPTQRDRHIQTIAEVGRMAWQRTSGYNRRAGVESQMARWKGALGEALRFHCDQAQATEVAIGVIVLNRMLDLGRPNSVRVA
ncbi:IS5 family transposase [Azospirillum sp.]|uniref:IS5 family transposase n=1 Tax=Azospirillum sp. TaxID=34012 RepID=UPI002D5050D3|nr:IS5 family transposase [Azospirillum sp.]HYF89567.1 IS5 family transposase [Azospirillum sp.]